MAMYVGSMQQKRPPAAQLMTDFVEDAAIKQEPGLYKRERPTNVEDNQKPLKILRIKKPMKKTELLDDVVECVDLTGEGDSD